MTRKPATVFISGSIRIKNIDKKIHARLDSLIERNHRVIIGDAKGVDSSIQGILSKKQYPNVTVYCSGSEVRNNIGRWAVKKIHVDVNPSNKRLFYTAKDLEMAKHCNVGMMIWDSKSTGTLSNVYQLLKQGKSSLVFINKLKVFKAIKTISDFEKLLSIMSQSAFEKADVKIGLKKKLLELKEPILF